MVQSERMGSVKQRWYRVYSPFAVDMITVKGFFYAHGHTDQMTICVQRMPDKKNFYAHGHTEQMTICVQRTPDKKDFYAHGRTD